MANALSRETSARHATQSGRCNLCSHMLAPSAVKIPASLHLAAAPETKSLYVYLQRQTLVHSVSNVTDRSSAMLFFNNTIANDFFEFDYFEEKHYSPAGKMVWICEAHVNGRICREAAHARTPADSG